jgi:hypothetical protein
MIRKILYWILEIVLIPVGLVFLLLTGMGMGKVEMLAVNFICYLGGLLI